MATDYSEDSLIEQPVVLLFADIDWETCDGFNEFAEVGGKPLFRGLRGEIVRVAWPRTALETLISNLSWDPVAGTLRNCCRTGLYEPVGNEYVASIGRSSHEPLRT